MVEVNAQILAESLGEAHWLQIAAKAWGCYVQAGRGALVGALEDVLTALQTRSRKFPASFVYATDLPAEAGALVANYDPMKEVVLILVEALRGPRAVSALPREAGVALARWEPSPPEAFKKHAS